MLKQKLNKIRYHAYKVRKAVEILARRNGSKCDLISDTLGGYCARASAMLSHELNRVGIEHNLAYGDGHMYIECEGYVIDITATQFDDKYGKTLIRLQEEMQDEDHAWKTDIKFSNSDSVLSWQHQEEWPENQIINEYDLDYV